MICGNFSSEVEVAKYIYNTRHSILLCGILLYAYKGDNSIKSMIISTNPMNNKMMISVFYDGYDMIYNSLVIESIPQVLSEVESDKKLKILSDNLKLKFMKDDINKRIS